MSDYECKKGHICKPRFKCNICGAKTKCVDKDNYIEFPQMSEEAEQEIENE